MKGKVDYPGFFLHNKMVEIDGEELGGHESLPQIECYRIVVSDDDVILLPKDKVRVLAE